MQTNTGLGVLTKNIPRYFNRFQILRDLLPHTDQKRDKATFLLEVRLSAAFYVIRVCLLVD